MLSGSVKFMIRKNEMCTFEHQKNKRTIICSEKKRGVKFFETCDLHSKLLNQMSRKLESKIRKNVAMLPKVRSKVLKQSTCVDDLWHETSGFGSTQAWIWAQNLWIVVIRWLVSCLIRNKLRIFVVIFLFMVVVVVVLIFSIVVVKCTLIHMIFSSIRMLHFMIAFFNMNSYPAHTRTH